MKFSRRTVDRFLLSLVLFAGIAFNQYALAFDFEHDTLTRADGSTLSYAIDRRDRARPAGLLVLMQGSGCELGTANSLFLQFAAIAPDHAVLVVEKYGVTQETTRQGGTTTKCGATFQANNSVDQRLEDYSQVISHLLDQTAWASADLILAGVSEGGLIAAEAAARLPQVGAVIMISSSPMTFGDVYKHNIRSSAKNETMPANVARQLLFGADDLFNAMIADPDPDKSWGGQSYQWWASILSKDPLDALIQVNAPILVIHGDRDIYADTYESRASVRAVREAGKCNLKYVEFEGLDHRLSNSMGQSQIRRVVTKIREWLEEEPSDKQCARN